MRAARAVLDLADRFDAVTYGHRLTVLYVLSGIYCITALLSHIFGQPLWEKFLASWSPRPRGQRLEADDQASLHRHLRKKNPALKVEREKPIRIQVEGTRRRIDLAIDDCVVIEMKRYIRRAADADRAFQQARAYATEWKDKGPVLLVLCETAAGFAQTLDLQGKIAELRANNYNVVAVAAGRERRDGGALVVAAGAIPRSGLGSDPRRVWCAIPRV